MNRPHVLIVGGTGVFGSRLARLLARRQAFRVSLGGRDEGKAVALHDLAWFGIAEPSEEDVELGAAQKKTSSGRHHEPRAPRSDKTKAPIKQPPRPVLAEPDDDRFGDETLPAFLRR